MTDPQRSLAIFNDLEAEQDTLAAVLARLSPGDWSSPSAAQGWSVADVVLHLAQTEELVADSATDAERPPLARLGSVDEMAAQMVAAQRGASPDMVFQRWQQARRAAMSTLRDCPAGTRLPWVAVPLSAATLATTRLAEHWAHALDITEPLGLPYPDTARLRHVAWLAMRTLPYAFGLDGQQPGTVRCELAAPGGDVWRFGPDDAASAITGPASAFCRVAAQRLKPADSGLTTTGPDGPAALQVLRSYAF
ncbi:MAG TPA: DinB family protein [Streptosporangiaceae bacterium]|nr:DinB family protein [Streptosporangiaceae bacterium]